MNAFIWACATCSARVAGRGQEHSIACELLHIALKSQNRKWMLSSERVPRALHELQGKANIMHSIAYELLHIALKSKNRKWMVSSERVPRALHELQGKANSTASPMNYCILLYRVRKESACFFFGNTSLHYIKKYCGHWFIVNIPGIYILYKTLR